MTTLNERSQLQDIDHFRALEARQQPVWPDSSELADTVAVLADVPPIVLSSETESLREQLAAAGRGEAFLLQEVIARKRLLKRTRNASATRFAPSCRWPWC